MPLVIRGKINYHSPGLTRPKVREPASMVMMTMVISTWVSIFLSVFDVHVNRAPIAGKLVRQVYVPGHFHLAYDDRASVENERLELTIENGRRIDFTLIAGLVARRIVPWKKEGEVVGKGDRIALIRFGSRVDIDLPGDCEVLVKEGDRLRGGSSRVARWR